ncbi:hypothetical protein WA1_30730 [Scytonema hofmannii PCC 7110]|jgi:hypothetical protein|uniref:Uncharacterized protein n=1 Tax=Scytonema hofmannii PCC 7110 TaxID=128403 RepID=A0A139X4S7_9CYAN|nr:hypothetical protein [Scytonema hofmannii]KYC39707.1 hypothetical protein WA1_30730 [Scytonema hofmannii PCC 7110]
MFLEELTPIFKQLAQHPMSFMGGFVSGMLKLNLADDPVKSWLSEKLSTNTYSSATSQAHNGKANGPQTISIE